MRGGKYMGHDDYIFGEDVLFWHYEDLDSEDKKTAKKMGCEPNKAYIGHPDNNYEAPSCPFCDKYVWVDAGVGCRHLVYQADGDIGYVYLHPIFAKVFWEDIFPSHKEKIFTGYNAKDLEELRSNGLILDEITLQELLPILKTSTIGGYCNVVEIELGFLPDEFIDLYCIKENDSPYYNVNV